MHMRHKRTFLIGILSFCLMSSGALAGPAEEMQRAVTFYTQQQLKDATEILNKLAEQNYLPAQALLGEMLDYTEADEVAVGWFIMAAFQGNAEGAYGLGNEYLTGEGIKKDPEQALYWIKFAAERDNLNAVKRMESAYRVGEVSGLPVKVDLKQADFWKDKAIILEAAHDKMIKEKKAVLIKEHEEKEAAIKKTDEEAAKQSRQGQTK